MGEKRGMKALEAWCRKVTDGYRDVAIQNMSSSWRDGLAFCALIHHFRPDLIDYDSLHKENIHHNNELAFSVAEKTLGIPSLLDAEDMVKYSVPDKLSIMTYVSQFYQFFEGSGHHARSPVKVATKRPVESPVSSASSPGSPGKVVSPSSPTSRRPDVCQICRNRVYILERLIIDSKLYHRTCFKCYRCGSVLKPAAYVDGPSPGQYECTSCPDEEEAEKAAIASMASSRLAHQNSSSKVMKWELPSVMMHRAYNTKPVTSPSAEARKLFLSNSVSEVGEENTNVIDSCVVNEKSESKQFSSVSSYLFGSDKQDSNVVVMKNNSVAKDDAKNSEILLGTDKVDRLDDCSVTTVVDGESENVQSTDASSNYSSVDNSQSSLKAEEEKISEVKIRTSLIKSDFKLPESSNGSETSTNQLDVSSRLRPVPSPRRSRKQDLSLQSVDSSEKSSEDIFSTPQTSPQVRLRTKTSDAGLIVSTVPMIPVRKTYQVPIRELNTSSTESTRPTSEAPLSPSKCGKVVLDMPVIQPRISRRMLSPPRTPEMKSASTIKDGTETSDSRMSEKIMDAVDGSCIVVADTKPAGEKPVGMVVPSTEAEPSLSTPEKKEEKKTPPPRPQLPAVLLKSRSPPVKKLELENVETEIAKADAVEYPVDLNPFGDEDIDDAEGVPMPDKKIASVPSLNPFDESDEEFEDAINSEEILTSTPKPECKRSQSPKGLNPFEDDDNESSSEVLEAPEDKSLEQPVSLSRTNVSSTGTFLTVSHSASSSPANSLSKASGQKQFASAGASPAVSPPSSWSRMTGQQYALESSSNVSPSGSISKGTHKKRPAPRPPSARSLFASDSIDDVKTPRSSSPHHHPKKSPAPLPPPLQLRHDETMGEVNEKTLKDLGNISLKTKEIRNSLRSPETLEDHRTSKVVDTLNPKYNTFGYWKKKKKPAPPIPLPPKRQTVRLNLEEIESELAEIEKKQLNLEQQGVELEKAIREKLTDDNTDSSTNDEENDLIIQLFECVNQKNVLFRRQSELVYMKRQQRLEEEHAELEFQIRCLMGKPECTKSKEELEREELLISRLVEIVKQRNEIIESIETDRLREAAEDQTIQEQLAIHQAGSSRSSLNSQGSSTSVDKDNIGKKEKKNKKKKEAKEEEGEIINCKEKQNSKEHDEDKDLDDVEIVSNEKKKKHKKNKWF